LRLLPLLAIPLTTEAVKAQFQMRRTFNPRLDRTWMLVYIRSTWL